MTEYGVYMVSILGIVIVFFCEYTLYLGIWTLRVDELQVTVKPSMLVPCQETLLLNCHLHSRTPYPKNREDVLIRFSHERPVYL